jgi:hypothetical protein
MESLVGKKFERLTVLEFVGVDNHGKSKWKCRCDCGVEKIVRRNNLVSGSTKSCGCLRNEKLKAQTQRTKHGHKIKGKSSPTYISWNCMKQRCYHLRQESYEFYGGRGITVCEHWRNAFATFLADMGEREPDTTLDRIDNEKGYLCPKCGNNCRWASKEVQTFNRRGRRARNRRVIPFRIAA